MSDPKFKRAAYILRTCSADMTSNGGSFTWPTKGFVEAPDWKPTKALAEREAGVRTVTRLLHNGFVIDLLCLALGVALALVALCFAVVRG